MMTMTKRFFLVSVPLLLLMVLTTACSWVKDDLGACPQYLRLRFYNTTPCDGVARHPERLAEMDRVVALSFFDPQSGRLVSHYNLSAVHPAKGGVSGDSQAYPYIQTRRPTPGVYTVVCWGIGGGPQGTPSVAPFEVSPLVDGTTLLTDARLALLGDGNASDFLSGKYAAHLYYGRIDNYEVQALADEGTLIDSLDINMKSFDNQLHLKIKGLDPTRSYTANITANNAAYDFRGVSLGQKCDYTRTFRSNRQDESVSANFTLLKLDKSSHSRLVVRDEENGRILYDEDLLSIIKAPEQYGQAAPINFECVHDFNLELDLEEKVNETYMLVSVTVNGWNVVMRDIKL